MADTERSFYLLLAVTMEHQELQYNEGHT